MSIFKELFELLTPTTLVVEPAEYPKPASPEEARRQQLAEFVAATQAELDATLLKEGRPRKLVIVLPAASFVYTQKPPKVDMVN